MRSIYAKLFDLLDDRERKRFYLLFIVILISGVVEMVSVASVLPFLAVVADPDIVRDHKILHEVYVFLDLETVKAFQIFLGLAVLGIVIIGIIVKMTGLYALSRFSQMRSYSISVRLFAAYLRQPYVWFLTRHSTDMSKAILYEVDKVVNDAMVPSLRVLSQTVSLILIVGLLFAINPGVAFGATLVLGGMYVVIFFLVRNMMTRLGQCLADANQQRYKVAHETFGGIKDVKLLGNEASYVARFTGPSRLFATTASTSTIVSDAPRFLLEAVAFGGMILLVLGMLLQGNTHLSEILPTLGVFAFAGLRMFPALQMIYNSLAKMRFVAPMLDNVHRDLIETRIRPVSNHVEAVASLQLKHRLDLVDVHYSYPLAERAAVRGLDFSILANTTVGIVGGTGAGKTTTVDIILGLLRPSQGAMFVDGAEVSDKNLRGWQNALGYVPQQIYLMDDTVAANIAFGVPTEKWDRAAIERAARMAELHDFVMSELPKGYDSEVGERGVRLSGGQRQRIGIARALYHDPDVLILDEATSALDNLTERAVMEAVHNLGNRKTIIMIAHRLTTVRKCDCIFLLEKGKVLDQGTYDDLIARNEIFRRMAMVDEKPNVTTIGKAHLKGV